MEYDTVCMSGSGLHGIAFIGALEYLNKRKHKWVFSVFFHLAWFVILSTNRLPTSVLFHDKIWNLYHPLFWIDRYKLVVVQPFAVLKRLNPDPALVIDKHTFAVRNVLTWLVRVESMFAVVHTIIAIDCRFRYSDHLFN